MWPDNDTDRDFLNFTGVAETVAEIVVQAQSRPISIGVSGAFLPSTALVNDPRARETHHQRVHETSVFRIHHLFVANRGL